VPLAASAEEVAQALLAHADAGVGALDADAAGAAEPAF
jgi:hypothetical protein